MTIRQTYQFTQEELTNIIKNYFVDQIDVGIPFNFEDLEVDYSQFNFGKTGSIVRLQLKVETNKLLNLQK